MNAHIRTQEDSPLSLHLCGFVDQTLYLHLLSEEGLPTESLVPINRIRVNVTIADPATGTETHLKAPGPVITSDERDDFLQSYEAALSNSSVMVFVGSLPLGLEENFYASLVEAAKEKAVHTILDVSGEPAKQALEAGPSLVKPNRSEFSTYVGEEWDPEKFGQYLRFFRSKGIRYGVVSHGAEGVYLFQNHRIIHCAPPEIESVSSVGAGDVLVAALAMDLANHGEVTEEGIKSAVAFATQSVTTDLPAHFDYEKGLRLRDKVSIREVITN